MADLWPFHYFLWLSMINLVQFISRFWTEIQQRQKVRKTNGLKHGTAMPPPLKKKLILPGILFTGFIAFFASGTHEFFSWQVLGQHYTTIKSFIVYKQWLSYLVFFCAYFVAVAFSLPIAGLLTLAGVQFWDGQPQSSL